MRKYILPISNNSMFIGVDNATPVVGNIFATNKEYQVNLNRILGVSKTMNFQSNSENNNTRQLFVLDRPNIKITEEAEEVYIEVGFKSNGMEYGFRGLTDTKEIGFHSFTTLYKQGKSVCILIICKETGKETRFFGFFNVEFNTLQD
ncbi:hypothetical protein [Brevibacillus porteri]|uniref:hypothetical protein n=1 Tax=Brevibacillus porteri TaxID=2126350 RepID=UPI003D223750